MADAGAAVIAENGPENGETDQQRTTDGFPIAQMRAITLNGFGGIKMVKVSQRAEVKANEGEVLIRVKACGLNFMDLMVRQGVVDCPPKTPITLGFECAGEVESLGENVTDFMPGDRVIAFCDYGAWAELVSVPVTFVYKMPTTMSYQDGAALPMSYLTAYIMLFEIGNLRPHQAVLVHSVGGGVGQAVSQLCHTVEGVTLFGTASYQKHEQIKNQVDHVFDHVVDYAQEIKKICPEGVDLVLDCLCGEDTNKGISLLKPMGKYVLYGSSNVVTGETKSFFSFAKSWWQVDKISPIKLYDENKSIAGFMLRQLAFKQGKHDLLREFMNKLFSLYNQGKIRPQIDSAWAYEDVGQAMQKMHDRKNIGKIILDPSLQPKPKKASDASESTSGADRADTNDEGGAVSQ